MNLSDWPKWTGQVLAYGAFALFVGYFSNSPAFRHLPLDQATIKLSLRHAGQILGECRERTAEELANQAQMLQHTITFFTINDTDQNTGYADEHAQSRTHTISTQKSAWKSRDTKPHMPRNSEELRDEQDDEFERY